MSIETEVLEITTEDAQPTTAPYKISGKVGKAILSFKVKATGSGPIRAVRVRLQPFLNRNSGRNVYSRGMVCGSGDRCGTFNARSMVHASPFTSPALAIVETTLAKEPDGEYEVKTWAMSAEDGWSS